MSTAEGQPEHRGDLGGIRPEGSGPRGQGGSTARHFCSIAGVNGCSLVVSGGVELSPGLLAELVQVHTHCGASPIKMHDGGVWSINANGAAPSPGPGDCIGVCQGSTRPGRVPAGLL